MPEYTEEELKQLRSVKRPLTGYKAPSRVSESDSQYDIGFIIPEEKELVQRDLNEQRARLQGNLDKAANGIVRSALKIAPRTAEGVLNPVVGSMSAVFNKDASKLWDNAITNGAKLSSEYLDKEFPLYSSEELQNASGFEKLLYANTYFGDILDGVSYSSSALLSGAAYNKVVSLIGKTAAAGTLKEFAGNISSIDNASDKIKYIKNVDDTFKTKIVGGLNKGTYSLIGATTEASDNALNDSKEWKDEMEYKLTHDNSGNKTRDITKGEEDWLEINRKNLGNSSFIMNLPVIMADNWITFGKIAFSKKGIEKGALGGVADKVGYNTAEDSYYALKSSKIDKILSKTYAGKELLTTAIPEGLQEVAQLGITKGSQDFYTKKYYNPESAKFVDSFSEGFNEAMSKEGLENFLVGSISSGLFGSGVKLAKEGLSSFKDPETGLVVDAADYLNKNKSKPVLKSLTESFIRHNNLVKEQQDAAKSNDDFEYMNKENDILTNLVISRIKTGKLDDLKSQLNDFKDLSTEEFEAEYGVKLGKDSVTGIQESVSSFVEKKLNSAERISDLYSSINNIAPTASEGVKDRLLYSAFSMENSADRSNELNNKAYKILNDNLLRYNGDFLSYDGSLINSNYNSLDKEGKKKFVKQIEKLDINPVDKQNIVDLIKDVEKLNERKDLFAKEYKALLNPKYQSAINDLDKKAREQVDSELDKDTKESQVKTNFAKEQEQRTANTSKPEDKAEPVTTEDKPLEVDIKKELDKLDKQEDAEIEALYRADIDDIDEAVQRVLDKYKKRREDLSNKSKETISSEDKKDLKDQEDKLKSEDKDNFTESKEFNESIPYEKTPIDALFDLQGKQAKNWNKTAGGEDNDKKLPEQRYFRFLEKNNLSEGTGLQLVTRKSNKKLFDQIFDKGAEDYEKSTGIDTIYAVFVDKDNNPIYSKQNGEIITDGSETSDNLVYATLLTEIGVNDTISGDKEAAIRELNKFRKQVLLQTSPVRVNVIKKSNGILVREKTETGKRKFNPALGYITTDIKRDKLLEIPVITVGDERNTRLTKNSQKALAGKLYAYDDNGIGIDLMARNLTESESSVLINLIQQRLGNLPRQKEVDDIGKEIDKLVYFGVPESGAKEYTLGIKDNLLYVGKDKVFTKEDMLLPENQDYVSNFLKYKKYVNANSKIPFNSKFRETLLNSEGNIEFKEWGSYQEFLLSNEGNRIPLFGTDIPPIGKPKFRNYYVMYDTNIINESIKLKESDIKPDLTPEYSTEIKDGSKESTIADIEKRRQEELNSENYRIPISKETRTWTDEDGVKFETTITTFKDGSKQVTNKNLETGVVTPITKYSKDLSNEKIYEVEAPNAIERGEIKQQQVQEAKIAGKINAKYDAELDALKNNKKDDTKSLDNKEKPSTFVDSKTGKKDFKKSGKSKIINLADEDVDNKDVDDAINKCK